MTAYGGPLKFRRYGRQGSQTYWVEAPWGRLGLVSYGAARWTASDMDGQTVGQFYETRRAAAAALPGGY